MAYQPVSTVFILVRSCARGCLAALLLGSGLVQAAEVEIRADSPTSYTVRDGDTLWDIADRFLEEPWLWPEVWQVNPQIRNPDLIYPGDQIELVYEGGAPVLRLSRAPDQAGGTAPSPAAAALPTVRLSPELRRDAILSPIPAIPMERISAYLSDNSVVAQQDFDAAPYLLAEAEGHALISAGDEVFARGVWSPDVLSYDIVRRGRELRDPDTGKTVGLEALALGVAELVRVNGDRGVLRVSRSTLEIKPGDRLIPRHNAVLESRYLPAPPDFMVDAAIVSIGSGRVVGGLYDSLIINVGALHGMKPGQLLAVREPPASVRDLHGPRGAWQTLKRAVGQGASEHQFPGKEVGTVLVYRVFDNSSLALVLRSSDAIRIDDRVLTP